MNKTYYIIALVIVIILVGVFVKGNKTEAPLKEAEEVSDNSSYTFVDGNYNIDTESSYLKWSSEFVSGLTKEDGTVKLKSGNVQISGGVITSGTFEIDMNTISDSGNKERLVSHLKSDDFFSVSKYPTSKFEITSFSPTTEKTANLGRFVVAGNLTIKGITKPISLITSMVATETGIEAESQFAINRAEWDIRYKSSSFFQNLGDKAIRDAVEIGLVLKAIKVAE